MGNLLLTTEDTEDTEKVTENLPSTEAYEIGRIQIETALTLYNENNLVCAIVLARSSDEYLGKLLKYSMGKNGSFHHLKSKVLEECALDIDLNYISNNLKHFNEDFCEKEHNLRLDAIQLLCRCITNYINLGLPLTKEMREFAEIHTPEKVEDLAHPSVPSVVNKNQTIEDLNVLSGKVVDCAIQAHKQLGPGLLESAYQHALAYMMAKDNIPFEKERTIPVMIDNERIDAGYRADFIVGQKIIIETKSVEKLLPIHEAQLLTYMKLGHFQIGLLLNFNETLLKNGIKRMRL